MKLCDRCFRKGDYKASCEEVITSSDEVFDLCESCSNELRIWIESPVEQINDKANRKQKK